MLPSNPLLLVPYLLIFIYFSGDFSAARDTIYPNQSISDGETLTSAGGFYKLGFFSPNKSSSNRYLAIRYNLEDSLEQPVMWVANREHPLTDTTGVLGFDEVTSNLVLTDASNRTLWSSNINSTPGLEKQNILAKLLDYGNLVIRRQKDVSEMWSSFDQLTDSLVPKSQLHFDLKIKKNNTIISWKSKFDPSPGNFAVGFSSGEFYQGFVYETNGSIIPYWRMGPWIGQRFVGIPDMSISTNRYGFNLYNPSQDEIIFSNIVPNDTDSSLIFRRIVIDTEGNLIDWIWNKTEKRWKDIWKKPENKCDLYGACGEFGMCDPDAVPICSCIQGFEPRSSENWGKGNFSGGCKRIKELACKRNESGDVFLKMEGVKVPDFPLYTSADNEKECEQVCSKKCICLAYTYVSKVCMVWDSGLLDSRTFLVGGETLHVKLDRLALDHATGNGKRKKLTISLACVLGTVVFCCALLLSLHIRQQKVSKEKHDTGESLSVTNRAPEFEEQVLEISESSPTDTTGLELLRYDMGKILTATNDFNVSNKLGEGGFGPVYKGTLPGDQQIAVKRLSRRSRQGLKEFKNEVWLISKLQHQNLVRLLGYCINNEEKLLIYEFMPNKSLDAFIFGESKKHLLDWSKRLDIIEGIARGLLYLHQDSRWRIIHRDLKASNILLDADLNPKISDFGTARIFGMDQVLETNTIVGTRGYISPEYIIHGQFSEKSDVYSFGVMVLEILSGRRIGVFYDEENSLNLLGYAWKLWKEGNVHEFIDMSLHDSFIPTNAIKCITMALLCVQELPTERPTMSYIISMLTNTNVDPHVPKEPPFSGRRDPSLSSYSLNGKKQNSSSFNMTLTSLQGR